MTYLERYLNGDHERVWGELLDLGTAVRTDPLYPDARAVARETMRRVRQNVEVLIHKLIRIGFVFGYDYRLLGPLSRAHQGLNWRAYADLVFWVQQQPPVFLPGNLLEESLAEEMRDSYAFDIHPEEEAAAYRQAWKEDPMSPPDMLQYLKRLEQEMGPLPLSVQAWYEEVGAVNFYGYHAGWDALVRSFYPTLDEEGVLHPLSPMADCDPLQVRGVDEKLLAEMHRYHRPEKPYELRFAPDRYRKDNQSGGDTPYLFELPDARADAMLLDPQSEGQITFVQYLRRSVLRWAGFPGMVNWPQVPQEDLTFLTNDLKPL